MKTSSRRSAWCAAVTLLALLATSRAYSDTQTCGDHDGSGLVAASDAAVVTMTFNSMPQNPGIDHIPWTDPEQARYLAMSYPISDDGISVFASAIEGKVEFSAAFNPNVLDRNAVRRALTRLQDMPSLLSSQIAEISSLEPVELERVQANTG